MDKQTHMQKIACHICTHRWNQINSITQVRLRQKLGLALVNVGCVQLARYVQPVASRRTGWSSRVDSAQVAPRRQWGGGGGDLQQNRASDSSSCERMRSACLKFVPQTWWRVRTAAPPPAYRVSIEARCAADDFRGSFFLSMRCQSVVFFFFAVSQLSFFFLQFFGRSTALWFVWNLWEQG